MAQRAEAHTIEQTEAPKECEAKLKQLKLEDLPTVERRARHYAYERKVEQVRQGIRQLTLEELPAMGQVPRSLQALPGKAAGKGKGKEAVHPSGLFRP